MVVEHLKKAWTAYIRNFWSVVGAYLLIVLIAVLATGGGVAIMMSPFMDSLAAGLTPTSEEVAAGVPMIVLGLVVTLIGIFVSVALQGGYIALTRDALKRKSKAATMFKTTRERWMSLIGTSILKGIITIIFLLPAIIVGLMAIGYSSWLLVGVAILFAIVAIFALLLFNFNVYAVALDRATAAEGITKSFAMVKRHYLKVLGLAILLLLIGGAVAAVNILATDLDTTYPPLGSILNIISSVIAIIFVGPFTMLAWTSCYLSLKNKK